MSDDEIEAIIACHHISMKKVKTSLKTYAEFEVSAFDITYIYIFLIISSKRQKGKQ